MAEDELSALRIPSVRGGRLLLKVSEEMVRRSRFRRLDLTNIMKHTGQIYIYIYIYPPGQRSSHCTPIPKSLGVYAFRLCNILIVTSRRVGQISRIPAVDIKFLLWE